MVLKSLEKGAWTMALLELEAQNHRSAFDYAPRLHKEIALHTVAR